MKSNNLIYDIHWSFICYAFKITKGHLPYLFLCKHVFIIFFNCVKTFDTCMKFRFNCNGFTRYILYFWFNTLVQIHVPKDVYMLNNGIPIKKSSYKEGMHSETETFFKWLRESLKWQFILNMVVYSHVCREDMWLIKVNALMYNKKMSAWVLDPDIL